MSGRARIPTMSMFQYGDYTGIAYDRDRELVWIAHNQQRKIVSYTFEDGSFERGEDVHTFASSSNSLIHCGRTSSMVRGWRSHRTPSTCDA